MNKKKVEELTDKEKEVFVNKLFNKKEKDYKQYNLDLDKDVERNSVDKTITIINLDIVEKIKEAIELNREVRYDLESGSVFIKKF